MENSSSLQNLVTTLGQDDKYIQDNQKLFGGIVSATNEYLSQGTALGSNTLLRSLAAQQHVGVDKILDQAFSRLMGDILSHTLEDKTGQATASNLNALQPFEKAYFAAKQNITPDLSLSDEKVNPPLSSVLEFIDLDASVYYGRGGSDSGISISSSYDDGFAGGFNPFPYRPGHSSHGGSSGGSPSGQQTSNPTSILSRANPTFEEAKEDIKISIVQFQDRFSNDPGTQQWVETVARMVADHQATENDVKNWILDNPQTVNTIVNTAQQFYHTDREPSGNRLGPTTESLKLWANDIIRDWKNGSTANYNDIRNWLAHGPVNRHWIDVHEGENHTQGYVPDHNGKHGIETDPNSGVTIGIGVDLGHHHESEIRAILGYNPMADSIINKINAVDSRIFAPEGTSGNVGLIGNAANNIANKLNITTEEAKFLSDRIYDDDYNKVKSLYDKDAGQIGAFEALPARTRTALIDFSYPNGPRFGKVTAGSHAGDKRAVWNHALDGNWQASAKDMTHTDERNTRFKDDRDLIESDINDGYLHTR